MRRFILLIVCLTLAGRPVWGQTSTNTFLVSIQPPANTVMMTQTVNVVSLTISNLVQFTNVTVQMRVGTNTTPLLDNGQPPDPTATDATYSGNLTVPAFPAATNFSVRFLTAGQDLAITNEAGELLPEASVTTTNLITYLAAVRPANDNFANASKLPAAGGLVLASNWFATIEPAEPWHGGDPNVAASLWWTWSPSGSGSVFVDTAGSSFAPVLAVYTGGTLATLKQVAASTNDLQNQLTANVTFEATAGVTYRLAVAGFDSEGMGDIRLRVVPGGGPDLLPPLVNVISPASESWVGTNLLTVTGTAKDLEPNATGISEVQVQLNQEPPFLATGTSNWTALLDLPPGTNVVRVVARDLVGRPSAPFVFVVRYVDPINDDFDRAVALADLAGVVTASNARASKEPGEPAHAGNEGGHSVWYSFFTLAPGSLQLSTSDSGFDTLLAVYTGETVTNLALVAANDDATPGSGYSELAVSLQPGIVYRVAVDGFGEESGAVQLRYTFTTILNYYSLTILPALGGTNTPPSGLYLAGSTQYVTALPARDFEFVRWQGSVDSSENPLTLVMTQNYTLAPSFRVISFTEGFETGGFRPDLDWASAGQAAWTVQSEVAAGGRFAARSGAIGDERQSALILDVVVIAGTASFDLRVSSESGWDGLEFYLNGVRQRRWSGQVAWQTCQLAVPAGRNRFEWRYVKDPNFNAGLDAAFLDNLYLPLPDSSLAARLAIARRGDAQNQVQVQGAPGRSYALEVSPDLAQWTSVVTNVSAGGSFIWTGPVLPDQPVQFYRAVLK